MRSKILLGILASLLVITGQAIAGVTSYDHTFIANDTYSSDFHTRLNQNFQRSLTGGINAITGANITDGSIVSGDFSQAVSPITRTYEGAACEFVYTGLLPTTSANLTTDTSAGTAYPRGYRINKASATAHTYAASKWTFVDIDQNGDFQYSEVAINGATPSVATNSIRLARVSSDGVAINTVTDLRTTSCADGPFQNIKDAQGESSLEDMMSYGSPIRKSTVNGGYITGLNVSWDSQTTFKVKSGSASINGKYRFISQDATVPSTADNPSTGVSGVETGSAPAASTTYNVFAVAEKSEDSSLSVTYGTGTTLAGLTYYRKIGEIKTDASAHFISKDLTVVNSWTDKETLGAYAVFDAYTYGTAVLQHSYNVSSFADGGSSVFTITWDKDFVSRDYVCSFDAGGGNGFGGAVRNITYAKGSLSFTTSNNTADAAADCDQVNVMCFGDKEFE